MRRIVFAHGLQSSPDGTKATYLRQELGAVSPWLGELGLDRQVRQLTEALSNGEPAILVGSSLGALAALGLVASRPDLVSQLVLLAPAVGAARDDERRREIEQRRPGLSDEVRRYSTLAVPPDLPATVIHALKDDVIRLDDVLELVRRSPSARLILVHDDHSLHRSRELILQVVRRVADDLDPLIGRG